MQTYAFRYRCAQVLPTMGFHASKLANEIPAALAIVSH